LHIGNATEVIDVARIMAQAEKNFDPTATKIPSICDDPTLPATPALRGVTSLIDPAVNGSDVANALANRTLTKPLKAHGKSVADLMAEHGL
jgi:hypothetical protein